MEILYLLYIYYLCTYHKSVVSVMEHTHTAMRVRVDVAMTATFTTRHTELRLRIPSRSTKTPETRLVYAARPATAAL